VSGRYTPKVDRRIQRDAVRLDLWLRRCSCRPDLRHDDNDVYVLHDAECPAVDSGTSLFWWPTHHWRRR
jgi:hypothetical protein